MTSIKTERKALRERNQALEDEILALEESSRRLRAQRDKAVTRLRTSQTAVERLSQQVAETEERARAAENDLENTRFDLPSTNRINSSTRTLRPVSDAVPSLQYRIAEAVSSLRVDPEYCAHYRMTTSTPARGPDRRTHPEFKEAVGLGLFVRFRGKITWLKIWLQEQY